MKIGWSLSDSVVSFCVGRLTFTRLPFGREASHTTGTANDEGCHDAPWLGPDSGHAGEAYPSARIGTKVAEPDPVSRRNR